MTRSVVADAAVAALADLAAADTSAERWSMLEGHALEVLGRKMVPGVLPPLGDVHYLRPPGGRPTLLAHPLGVGDAAAVAAWARTLDAQLVVDVPDDPDHAFRRTCSTTVRLCRHVDLQLFTVRRVPSGDPGIDAALDWTGGGAR